MNIALITSDNLRHIHFAKTLCENIDVSLIVFEHKPYSSQSLKEKELKYFPECSDWTPDVISGTMAPALLKDMDLDYIFTFGCGLLKPDIYNIPRYGYINIHTGLVQYYRGVDSSLWAIMDERLDLVGSTLHYIDNTIDGGKVLRQRQLKLTKLSKSDTLDDVFLKNCMLGVELLVENLNDIINNNLVECTVSKGRLYQNKDKNDEIISQAAKKLKEQLR